MQIVIDISKEQYSLIMQSHRPGVERFICKEAMIYAIRNGTFLPKEHGRLIDESKITKCYMPINQFDVRGIRTDAPTIIDAAKEREKINEIDN